MENPTQNQVIHRALKRLTRLRPHLIHTAKEIGTGGKSGKSKTTKSDSSMSYDYSDRKSRKS